MTFAHTNTSKGSRVFVSFSTRDQAAADLVRWLLIHLREQPLSAWMYESISEQIPPGADIDRHCKKEIARAQLCMAVISDACFKSPWTRAEIRYALSLQREEFVVPVVMTDTRAWPEPYDRLTGCKNLVRIGNISTLAPDKVQRLVKKAVEAVCARLCIPYFEPGSCPRLPLRSRTWVEVWLVEGVDDEYRARQLELLNEACKEFSEEYDRGDHDEALKCIQRIIRLFNRHFPGAQVYYPNIVEALVRFEAAGNDTPALMSIRNDLHSLLESVEKRVDANLFGLLGSIEQQLAITHEMSGREESASLHFRAAVKHFKTGLKMLTTRDPAAIHNLLLAELLAGDNQGIRSSMRDLQAALDRAAVLEPGDLARLNMLYAFSACISGDVEDGIARFRELSKTGLVGAASFGLVVSAIDTIWKNARLKMQIGLCAQAVRVAQQALQLAQVFSALAKPISPTAWYLLVQRLAFLQKDFGLFDAALVTVRSTLCDQAAARSLQPLIDAALICHAAALDAENCGNDASAAALQGEAQYWRDRARAIRLTDRTSQLPLMNANEFADARGLAHWLACEDTTASTFYGDAGGTSYARPYVERFSWVQRDKLCQCLH